MKTQRNSKKFRKRLESVKKKGIKLTRSQENLEEQNKTEKNSRKLERTQ